MTPPQPTALTNYAKTERWLAERVRAKMTSSDFVKTSRNNLSNKIENYKEVRQALRGTPWEFPKTHI